jgi:hypothetical protein
MNKTRWTRPSQFPWKRALPGLRLLLRRVSIKERSLKPINFNVLHFGEFYISFQFDFLDSISIKNLKMNSSFLKIFYLFIFIFLKKNQTLNFVKIDQFWAIFQSMIPSA